MIEGQLWNPGPTLRGIMTQTTAISKELENFSRRTVLASGLAEAGQA